jgi:hypothetical protein
LGPPPFNVTPLPREGGFFQGSQSIADQAFLYSDNNADLEGLFVIDTEMVSPLLFDITLHLTSSEFIVQGVPKLPTRLVLISKEFGMRESDFDLISDATKAYLINVNDLRIIEEKLKPSFTKKKGNKQPKTAAVQSDDELKELKMEKQNLEGKLRTLRKEICCISIRSIWPANTHRVYSHPRGLREGAALQKKSKFHVERFRLMVGKCTYCIDIKKSPSVAFTYCAISLAFLTKMVTCWNEKIRKYYSTLNTEYQATPVTHITGSSGSNETLKRWVSFIVTVLKSSLFIFS